MRFRSLILAFICSLISYTNGSGQNYDFPLDIRSCRSLATNDTVTLTFIGDVMLHGRQLKHALKEASNSNSPESYNFENAFKYVAEEIRQADVAVANMEFPIGTAPYSGYPLFSAPESIIWYAKKYGFNLFLLANNHIMDQGKKGFLSTIEAYKRNNADYVGAYLNKEDYQSQYPKIIRIRDLKIAFLNFTYGTNGIPVPAECHVNRIDTLQIKESIAKAKGKGAEIIIALPHWGEEYQQKANNRQEELANFMIKNGVDIIIGSHPHVTQNGYITNKNVVFYSLGNYISNQSVPPQTQLGLMVKIKIAKDLIKKESYIAEVQHEYIWCFRSGEFNKDYTVVKINDIINCRIPGLDSVKRKKAIDTFNIINDKKPIKNYTLNIN